MHTIARTVARAPLRARLTATSVLLVALGLVAAGVATHFALRSFLTDRIDQEFGPAEGVALHYVSDTDHDTGAIDNALPLNAFVVVVLPNGRLRRAHFHGTGSVTEELRELAQRAPVGYSSAQGYRVRSLPTAEVVKASGRGGGPPGGPQQQLQTPPGRLVIAISTHDVNSTLDRLDRLETVIGLVVVVIAGALAWALVRVELRPLRRIEDTAAAIAAGDLSRRSRPANPAPRSAAWAPR